MKTSFKMGLLFLFAIISIFILYFNVNSSSPREKYLNKIHFHQKPKENQSITFKSSVKKRVRYGTVKKTSLISVKKEGNHVEINKTPEKYPKKIIMTIKEFQQLSGDRAGLKWQKEYDKGIYEPQYDYTWKEDMLSETYSVVAEEPFAGNIEVENYNCQDEKCTIEMKDLNTSETSNSAYAAFIRRIKEHPAILHSGKKRNVYLQDISIGDQGRTVKIIIK